MKCIARRDPSQRDLSLVSELSAHLRGRSVRKAHILRHLRTDTRSQYSLPPFFKLKTEQSSVLTYTLSDTGFPREITVLF